MDTAPGSEGLDDETRDYIASRAHLPTLVHPMSAKVGEYVHGLMFTGEWPRDGATANGYRRAWVYEAARQSWRCEA